MKFDWVKLRDTNPQCLYILPEATAILAIGSKPNHTIAIIEDKDKIKINGHSVMMGYVDAKANNSVFKSGRLVILR